MQKHKLTIFLLSILLSNALFSQKFSGKILDNDNNETLAFVNIIYNSKNLGTSSDIDGFFFIENINNIEFLKISYIGYEEKIITKEEIGDKKYLVVKLKKSALYLSEVVVFPGVNPAHRIIDAVIENANKNNPEKMRSFSYISYNRIHFTIDTKQINKSKDTVQSKDTTSSYIAISSSGAAVNASENDINRLDSILSKQHLFLTEAVTERKFKYPDNNNETIIAQRVSGFKNPSFTLLASQFQSMSFYKDYVVVFDKKYLSPLSKGSTKKYFFQIEDTVYNEKADTIFIISYRPLRNKVFDGLEGVLHINTNGYAVQNATAKPHEKDNMFDISIQQRYELIDDTQWFPVQLNTDIVMSGGILIVAKSYINDISLNPEYKRKTFNQYEVSIKDDSHKKDESFWKQYRKEELTEKDIQTYNIVDSIGKEYKFEYKLRLIEILATGSIPYKFINIDLNSIYWYNNYEGSRLGLRLTTNDMLSRWFSVSGYFAYGFRDKAWKYGGNIDFLIDKKSETHFELGYSKDLSLSDNISFIGEKSLSITNSIMTMFLTEMDSATRYYTTLRFESLKYLKTNITFSYTDKNLINLQRYDYLEPIYKNFSISELSINFRYAYKEKFIQTPRGAKLSLGTKYPVLKLNIKKGLVVFDAKHDYLKLEGSISKKFVIRHIGETSILINGALTQGFVPYSNLYYIVGINTWIGFDNCFNTMKLNEFISDRFAAVFFKHNFGCFYKSKHFSPELAITTAAGWGDARLVGNSTNNDFAKIMNKGYFESGVQINSILKASIFGYGLGVYYRYRQYALPKEIQNWAFKLSITTSF